MHELVAKVAEALTNCALINLLMIRGEKQLHLWEGREMMDWSLSTHPDFRF
jgi:hypothetical protein